MRDYLDRIATAMVASFLLAHGLDPLDGWDPNDPNCRRECGPHVLWTVQGHVKSGSLSPQQIERLQRDFGEYLIQHNSLPTAVKFGFYSMEVYECSCGCGQYIFVTIFQ